MLSVRDASVFFEARDGRAVQALHRVSLDIPPRGFVVALGTLVVRLGARHTAP